MSNRFQDNLAELVTLIRKLRNESQLKPRERASTNRRFAEALNHFVQTMAISYSSHFFSYSEIDDLVGELSLKVARSLLKKTAMFKDGVSVDDAPDERIKGWLNITTGNLLKNHDAAPENKSYRSLLTMINRVLGDIEKSSEISSSKIVDYRIDELRTYVLGAIDESRFRGKAGRGDVSDLVRSIINLAGGMIERRDLNDLLSEITGISKYFRDDAEENDDAPVPEPVSPTPELAAETVIDIESEVRRLLTRIDACKDPRLLPILCYEFVHGMTLESIGTKTKMSFQNVGHLFKNKIERDLYTAIRRCSEDDEPDVRVIAKFREKIAEELERRGIRCEG